MITSTVQWIARTRQQGSLREGTTLVESAPVATEAVFAPGGSAELTSGGDTVTTQPALSDVDPTLPVKATDLFVVDGDRYEVDGKPKKYPPNPFTGTQKGQVVQLREVTG